MANFAVQSYKESVMYDRLQYEVRHIEFSRSSLYLPTLQVYKQLRYLDNQLQ